MKVSIGLIVLLILNIGTGAALVVAAYRLYRRCRFPYLFSYLVLVTAWCVFGILGLVYSVLVPQVVPPGIYSSIIMLNYFLIIPMVFVMLYFFTDFVVRLMEKSLSRVFKWGFAILFFIFLALLALRVSHILSQPGPHSLSSLYPPIPILRIIKWIFVYGSLFYLFLNLKYLESPVKRKYFSGVAITFAVGFTLSEICMMGLLPVYDLFLDTLITNVVFYGTPLIVLFILKRFLTRYYASRPLEQPVKTNLDSFFEKYGISKREGEIIELIIKGHSNREIEDKLFISLETVKKHIYNIYKKTRVKNRLQLNYLIRNYIKQDT
ncbi:MAG: helix-turn-helix transcriptional regulator [Candidatus Aminicenantes bacterium]|jgi:DNA-binding CsgD family transcriptional regulator